MSDLKRPANYGTLKSDAERHLAGKSHGRFAAQLAIQVRYVEGSVMTGDRAADPAFAFGENWARFLTSLSDEQIEDATRSVSNLVGRDLRDKTFIDVGSGSGLFSLAARKLGARVHSFDYDPRSAACTQELRRRFFPRDDGWTVDQGSVLDEGYLATLGQFDVVYSWGVLHHTGNMWVAIANAAGLVRAGGIFIIGIYNFRDGRRGTATWRKLKRWYCRAPRWQREVWESVFTAWKLGYMVAVGRNPVRMIREYHGPRGMSWRRDVTDWLGGYPYEAATPGEILEFVRRRVNFVLVRQNIDCGLGVSEFVFECPVS
jgi:2-polyprenyl-3-methyl-5-hydroxy-6-metoxy-1,4-benzoquinol methylase